MIGPFLFKDSDKPENLSSDLKSPGPIELDNKAFYHGQWNEFDEREGMGV